MKSHWWIPGLLGSISLLCLWIVVLRDSKRLDKLDRQWVAAALKETQTRSEEQSGDDAIRLGRTYTDSDSAQAGIESGQQPKAIPDHFADLHQVSLALQAQVVESLSGNVHPNLWMDLIAEFVQFELSPIPVENWRSDDEEAFEFLIGSEDVKAYLTIEKEDPVRMAVRVESNRLSFLHGSYRRDQSLIVFFSGGRKESDGPENISLQTYAKVALGYSRQHGVNCYKGEFREGIIYQNNQAFQFGIKDGKPSRLEGECSGDLLLDESRVNLLWQRIQMLRGEIK